MTDLFSQYKVDNFFDEMFSAPGVARPHYSRLLATFKEMGAADFARKRDLAAASFLSQGVTFTVYDDDQGTERIFPFDLVPRIIPAREWDLIERGLTQRITALNLFLHDIYHGQSILREGVIPKQIVWEAVHFRPEFMHFDVPRNIYIHICGTDLDLVDAGPEQRLGRRPRVAAALGKVDPAGDTDFGSPRRRQPGGPNAVSGRCIGKQDDQ